MKKNLENKLNGWRYLGILMLLFICINIFLEIAAESKSDLGLQIIFYLLSFIFLLLCLFFSFHRSKRVYGSAKVGFYVFAYSFIHINIFGSSFDYVSSYDELQMFEKNQPTLYFFTLITPFLQIYAAIYNLGLIFKNSLDSKNENI